MMCRHCRMALSYVVVGKKNEFDIMDKIDDNVRTIILE